MNWLPWRRRPGRIADEEPLRALGDAPDEVKEQWHRARLKTASLDPTLIAEVESASEEENEAGMAEEIRTIKRRSKKEWKLLLASLPAENQEQLRDIERRYGV